jgi:hypothetical protein
LFVAEKGDGSGAYGEGPLPAGHRGKGKKKPDPKYFTSYISCLRVYWFFEFFISVSLPCKQEQSSSKHGSFTYGLTLTAS